MMNFLATVLLLSSTNSFAKENLRYFESTDSQSKVYMLELEDSAHVLLKLDGIKHVDAGQVLMFSNERNERYSAVNGATDFSLIDYNKKTLVEGTIKKSWTLAGLNKLNDTLIEKSVPGSVKAEMLKKEYEKTEGAGDYGLDIGKINQVAEKKILDECKVKITVKSSGVKPAYKAIAAVHGLTMLCADKDYAAAIKEYKSLMVNSDSATEASVQKAGSALTITLGKESQNTANSIKNALAKGL